jgi:hypothetical protein
MKAMSIRVIYTKYKTHLLPADQPGIPAQEYFAGIDLPEQLKTATVYETPDGPVLTLPAMPKKRRAVKPKTAVLS